MKKRTSNCLIEVSHAQVTNDRANLYLKNLTFKLYLIKYGQIDLNIKLTICTSKKQSSNTFMLRFQEKIKKFKTVL